LQLPEKLGFLAIPVQLLTSIPSLPGGAYKAADAVRGIVGEANDRKPAGRLIKVGQWVTADGRRVATGERGTALRGKVACCGGERNGVAMSMKFVCSIKPLDALPNGRLSANHRQLIA
jgi:hypothetical protein